ncbi:MAG TPA: UDP-N-acetylglucosamine 2-epimerase (non-hydrolyzing) [Terriglobales bacterium]|nr:UDP-N-acetylglucosamine 2-epimerase (non-hydrolyzing) [Terriglobales bacterium]
MLVLHVVGARPNFMKAAPLFRELQKHSGIRQVLIHTGQHYDVNMSDVFFQQLRIPAPDVNLQVSSKTHAQQTAEIMSRLEGVVLEHRPDWVLVYGDVNSTAAAALVCAKLQVRVAHVEAGLRSYDRSMPEELNRLVTDQLSDLLFTPSEDANRNLAREGIPAEKVHLVGNIMIDTLIEMLPESGKHMPADVPPRFGLVTLHRPSNVDDPHWLREMLAELHHIASELPIIFPVHPRTRERIAQLRAGSNGLRLLDPLPYLSFLALQQRASIVVTDSGGIQEETTYLGVPCLTVRDNTERPITIDEGTNVLVGRSPKRIREEIEQVLAGKAKQGRIPALWDGKTSQRIASVLMRDRARAARAGSLGSA